MSYESRFPQIIAEIEAGCAEAVQKTGYMVEAGAKKRARVDTGYMRGQIRWIPTGALSGEVVGGAHYTIFNEFGTRYMTAQPMFIPAIEEARPFLLGEIRAVLRKVSS